MNLEYIINPVHNIRDANCVMALYVDLFSEKKGYIFA